MGFAVNHLIKNGKILQILNDFVIKEEVCNMNCDYCLTEGAALKEKHDFTRDKGRLNFKLDLIEKELVYSKGYSLKESIDKCLDKYLEGFDAPILKISGGEVLLIKNLSDLLVNQSTNYEVVQVLTNGMLFNDELVQRLKEIPNINIQFSLDGHTLQMNNCRVKSQELQNRLLSNLDQLVSNGITTEIYCVVSCQNIDFLPHFAKYVHTNYGDKVHLVFFPVRQGAAKRFLPQVDRLNGLAELIEEYHCYESILPPLAYLQEMYLYLKTRRRESRCYVPLTMFQDFEDGIVTPCPNCWTVQIGNLLEEKDTVIQNMAGNRIYKLMTAQPPLAPFCVKCYTDYHLFNLYFNGVIGLDEMVGNRPLLQGQKVKERLGELKEILSTKVP